MIGRALERQTCRWQAASWLLTRFLPRELKTTRLLYGVRGETAQSLGARLAENGTARTYGSAR